MTEKRIKLSDIAKELDVSVGLVSLVLSGKSKENRISDSLAKKVTKKAREMGYQANQLARGLRTGKSGVIGLIVADIANPYFGKMARYIENEALKNGYQVMFGSSDENPEKLKKLVDVFLARQVDAMIIVPVLDSEDYLKSLKKQPVPVVYIDRYSDGVDEDVCCCDNYDGTFKLAKLLIDKGYRKIGAFVFDQKHSNNRDRILGYKAALKASAGYVNSSRVFPIGFDQMEENLEPAIDAALDEGCDALLFANNSIGIRGLRLLDEKGKQIPKDLGAVSFDNPEAFQLAKPGITCFEQPIEKICSRAVKIVSQKINGKNASEPKIIKFKGHLIERNSC